LELFMRLLAPGAFGVLGFVVLAHADERARPIEGEPFARVSVTVDPDESGTIEVPSPFTIVPGTKRVAIHVPEAEGIFLLEGERILHHYPREDAVMHDLEATERMIVAGQRSDGGAVNVILDVFDLETGEKIDHVQSANPYLRIEGEGSDLWRVVVAGNRVGVYQPGAGASYPLWDRDTGYVASSEQIARASAGIGFGGETAWIPHPDGSISRKHRGQTRFVTDVHGGEFIDPVSDRAILLLQPAESVRSDADGDFLLPRELGVRIVDDDGSKHDFQLVSLSSRVRASRLVIQGRPVRVYAGRVYWIYLGIDFLEIRSTPIGGPGGAGS
jgi:hypothetical protein